MSARMNPAESSTRPETPELVPTACTEAQEVRTVDSESTGRRPHPDHDRHD